MFLFGRKKAKSTKERNSQHEIGEFGKAYEKLINDFAQIDGIPLNRFTYKTGHYNSSNSTFTFFFQAEEELVLEEVLILEEAFTIMIEDSFNVSIDLKSADEIQFNLRML